MVHRRELEGDELLFGNQGDLWGNAMTWWDHGTGSVWSQPLGESIAGPLKGERIELYPSTLTTWGAWKEAHPRTAALDVHGWATGFHLEQMVIVVDMGTEASSYVVTALREAGIVNDEVAGIPIAVVFDPANDDRWSVFSRRLVSTDIELELSVQGLVDVATGTVFDPFTGVGISGPLADEDLDKLSAFTMFPSDYLTFFPDGVSWPGS
jgi:hypothetical protein